MVKNLPANARDLLDQQEMWVPSLGQEDCLEGYSSWGGKRVVHDSATKQQQILYLWRIS